MRVIITQESLTQLLIFRVVQYLVNIGTNEGAISDVLWKTQYYWYHCNNIVWRTVILLFGITGETKCHN